MNSRSLFAVSILFIVLLAGGCAADPGGNTEHSQERIGIYDSRAIAIAFVGGEVFRETMNAARMEFDEATKNGDEATLARINTQMQERQKLLHAQGFSTAPVDELIAHYSDGISTLLDEA